LPESPEFHPSKPKPGSPWTPVARIAEIEVPKAKSAKSTLHFFDHHIAGSRDFFHASVLAWQACF
jgi:hypothetical protein